MHLAEYYIALRARRLRATSPRSSSWTGRSPETSRTSSGARATSSRTTSRCSRGWRRPAGRVTNLDLELARLLVANHELKIPSPRSQLLKLAALSSLFDGEEMDASQRSSTSLGADRRHLPVLREDLARARLGLPHLRGRAPTARTGSSSSGQVSRTIGSGSSSAALAVADHVFNPKSEHPLRIRARATTPSGGSPPTTSTTSSSIFVLELTRRAWSESILPIGLTKDSGASELVKTVVPLLQDSRTRRLLARPAQLQQRQDAPADQQRGERRERPHPVAHRRTSTPRSGRWSPWPTTSLPRGEARARGAYRNVIYPERMFVKTYIQLWSSKNDPAVRSHVFTFDRPAYPGYDHWGDLVDPQQGQRDRREDHPDPQPAGGVSDDEPRDVDPRSRCPGRWSPRPSATTIRSSSPTRRRSSSSSRAGRPTSGPWRSRWPKSELDQQVLFSQRFRDYRSQVEAKRKGGQVR